MPLPSAALLDSSVLLRLLHDHHDAEQSAVRLIEDSWRAGDLALYLLDLSIYECLNVCVRRLGFTATRAATAVGYLYDLDLPIVAVDRELAVETARLAAGHQISGYDAAFVAAARALALPLITADRKLAERAPGPWMLLPSDLATA